MKTIEKQKYLENLKMRQSINKSFFYLYLNNILNSFQYSILARTSEIPKEIQNNDYKIFATRALHVSKNTEDFFTTFFNKSGKYIFSTNNLLNFTSYLRYSSSNNILVLKLQVNSTNYFLTKFDYDELTRSLELTNLNLLTSVIGLTSNVVDASFFLNDCFMNELGLEEKLNMIQE
jgi:hypothetical protein